MRLLGYTLICLCGLALGWALTSSTSLGVLLLIIALAVACGALLRSRAVPDTLSVAHRHWLSSSLACALVLLGVWGAWGWSLPPLSLSGLTLDPAGALGWDASWLSARLRVVMLFMALGAVGLVAGLLVWVVQKQRQRAPRVVLLWGVAPFFWLAGLGILMSMANPWRAARVHEKEIGWSLALTGPQLRQSTEVLLSQGTSRPDKIVWAHALALRAFQKNAYTQNELLGVFDRLATLNRKRPSGWFPPAQGVGVERSSWCIALHARTSPDASSWSHCLNLPPGRVWWPSISVEK